MLAAHPAYVSGDANANDKLDLTETWVFEAPGTAEAGEYDNVGTAYGTGPADDDVWDDDPSSYFGADPQIDVEKYVRVNETGTWEDADDPRGPSVIVEMDVVYFKFVVKNTGNVTLTNVTLDGQRLRPERGDDPDDARRG